MNPAVAPSPAAVLEMRGAGARVERRWIVRGIDLQVAAGEMIAVIGPSGAGKSTLARLALGLVPAAEGSLNFDGREWAAIPAPEQRRLRARLGYVQQDPARALDPTMTVAAIVCEGLELHNGGNRRPRWGKALREWRRATATEWLERVGVGAVAAERYPHELSGGQRQRVAIARAMITRPRLLVADEPAAALDAATGAQVMTLLGEVQKETGTAVLLVTHQLALAAACADRLAVLALEEGVGKLVEMETTEAVLQAPRQTITQALLEAVPAWPPT